MFHVEEPYTKEITETVTADVSERRKKINQINNKSFLKVRLL